MGAYLLTINTKCITGCGRRATVRVFNTFNSSQGEFCNRCGKHKLKELQRGEAAIVRSVIADRK